MKPRIAPMFLAIGTQIDKTSFYRIRARVLNNEALRMVAAGKFIVQASASRVK